MSIIERIVKVLDLRGKDQKELCMKTGIKESTFSGWKKRFASIPADKLLLIADFLGVSMRYLLTGEDEETALAALKAKELDEQEEELLRIFNSLNIRGKAALISYAYELEEQNK